MAAVTVDVLMCSKAEAGPSVTHHGWPCAAKIALVNAKHRVLGVGDAIMFIATEVWEKLVVVSREALIDHELRHLEVVIKDGVIERDCAGRPKLGIVPHDYELGGFHENVRLYGSKAMEAISLAHVMASETGQLLFRGFDVPAGQFDFAVLPDAQGPGNAPEESQGSDTQEPGAAAEGAAAARAEGDEAHGEDDSEHQQLEQAAAPAPAVPPWRHHKPAELYPEGETMIARAIEVLRETKRASVSSLQRRLRLGYAPAARIMDILEERGHVGPPKKSGEAREILQLPDPAAAAG